MNTDDKEQDLPVLRVEDQDLPVLIPESEPRHERARVDTYPGWSNFASQRLVRSLAADPTKGEVWLATGAGVLQWVPNRNCFTRYTSEHGLPGNSAVAVAIDGNGLVWVSHERYGISYLDGGTWKPYVPLEEIAISCLSRDVLGRVWAGSEQGIYVITNPSGHPIAGLPLFIGPPRAIAVTGADNAWSCSAGGVFHFEHGDWVRFNDRPDVLTLLCQFEHLWLGTLNGLFMVNLSTGTVYQSGTWPVGEVTALSPATEGVWAAVEGEVGRAIKDSWLPISRQRFNVRVTGLAEADDNEIWIGTHNGLLYGDPRGIHFRLTDTPPDVIGFPDPRFPSAPLSNMIQSLVIQLATTGPVLWIGTPIGLFCLDILTKTWKQFLGIGDVRALAINATNDGIWIASWSRGLCHLKEGTIQTPVSGTSHPVLALAIGQELKCWAAGLDGLYQAEESGWKLVVPIKKFSERSWIRTIAQARTERLWLGTSQGLFAYYPDIDALSIVGSIKGTPDVLSLLPLAESDVEYLWVGTSKGLYNGQPNELKPVSGLERLKVTALVRDEKTDMLWVGTTEGLFQVRQQGNEWVIASIFTVSDSGLAADRITALALSRHEPDEHMLWIGTPCGLSCYTYKASRRLSNGRH